ncbi:MAG TPA: general secretion pathway protein GspK, partial [Chromatiaceae bacterium]|nr:general secretion pathway protein GspK [Chromatiaceae bacterium]
MAGNDLRAAGVLMARRERGIALVLVLWVVVLLGVIAGAMSMTQRSGVAMVANHRLERQGRALVEAGIHFMMLQLDNRNKPVEQNPWPTDGRLHPWRFAGRTIWIGAMPETGRIDLNQADENLLLGVLRAAGLDEEQAIAVRDAILDWRDADDGMRPAGAEDDDYLEAGRPLGARDGPFLSVEELRQVRGVTAELYKRLAPLLTVDSGQRTVNPVFASKAVLQAIPDLDPELIDQFLLERRK